MHDKIKELLVEAGWPSEYINAHFEVNKRGDIEAMKRFAELVITECMEQCNPEQGIKYSPNSLSARAHCRERIQKHFGIEQ